MMGFCIGTEVPTSYSVTVTGPGVSTGNMKKGGIVSHNFLKKVKNITLYEFIGFFIRRNFVIFLPFLEILQTGPS